MDRDFIGPVCRALSRLGRALAFWGVMAGYSATAQMYPPVHAKPLDPSAYEPLRRTLALLASSGSTHPVPVRIVFHGQSITLQYWVVSLVNWLRATYPLARIDFHILALHGFSTELLLRTVDSDVVGVYPDLILFQAYGDLSSYAKLIRRIRAETTADILLQTDHLVLESEKDEVTEPEALTPAMGGAWKSYGFLPALGRRTDSAVADVRQVWHGYLREYGLKVSDLLMDTVHLNFHGDFVLDQALARYLKPPADLTLVDPFQVDGVRTYQVGRDILWHEDRLELECVGNRIDLVFAQSGEEDVEVEIDGQLPSDKEGVVRFLRPSPMASGRLTLVRASSFAPLIPEQWTVRLTESSVDGARFRFVVTGSVTGEDGEGVNTEFFRSKSGRVVIEPQDWRFAQMWMSEGIPITPGMTVTWNAVQRARDRVVPSVGVVTVAQGMADGAHRVVLKAGSRSRGALVAVRAYSPGRRSSESQIEGAPLLKLEIIGNPKGSRLRWRGWFPDFELEDSDGRQWPDREGWHPWKGGIGNDGGSLTAEIPTLEPQRFFRLRALPAAP